ncbi:9145_t:CDS:2 [Dentiscutata erythropus]|uniref:9145_t:CDS:1 n=1 Tax=Dentiscutata erythropus TaxID=1348616 RepID=A0A9N9CM95_9GLOM|nr:9145_t:CDS:2 [Dentiscutata erythropus]
MMHNYTNLLISGAAIFKEDIQLYDSEDDFEDDIEDNLEDNFITNNLSKVDSNKVIDHGENDFDIDELVNQEIQIQNALIDKEN